MERYDRLRQGERVVRGHQERWVERALEMTQDMPAAVEEVAGQLTASGLTHPIIARLADAIAERARTLGAMLTAESRKPSISAGRAQSEAD